MAHPALKALLAAPRPAFLCKIQAARSDGRTHVVPLQHTLRNPASQRALDQLKRLHPDPLGELQAFYAEHDGAVLYKCRVSGEGAIAILPVAEIAGKTKSMRAWFDVNDDFDGEKKEDPYGLRSSIAVGMAPNSADYFAMPTTGVHAGKVFFLEHDCSCDGPLFDSFTAFLDWLANDPLDLIRCTGLHTHYRDGKTSIRWQPLEYSPVGEFSSRTEA